MSNSYYTPTGTPGTGTFAASAPMRAEFNAVGEGFDLLPALSAGAASRAVVIASDGMSQTLTTGTLALAGAFATTGAHATTLVTGADVSLTLPLVSGTLATLVGTESLSNKTLVAPIVSGTVVATDDLGTSDGTAYHFSTTISGSGSNDVTGLSADITTSGSTNITQTRSIRAAYEGRHTSGTQTTAVAVIGYGRLGLSPLPHPGGPGSTTGDVTVMRALDFHIANESTAGTIGTAVVYNAGDVDLADGAGTIGTMIGLNVQDLGHATRVTSAAASIKLNDMTAGAPLTAGLWSTITAGNNKWGLYDSGGANHALLGKLGVGATTAPTSTLHTISTMGTVSAGTTSGVQHGATFTGDASGTSDVRGVRALITASGANNVASTMGHNTGVVLSLTGATAAATWANNSFIQTTSSCALTTGFVFSGQLAIAGSGNVNTAVMFEAAEVNLSSGTGTISDLMGFRSRDLGHATRVTASAVGFHAVDMTAGATTTAAFRTAMTTGTGKWAFLDTGGANSALAGNLRIGSNVAPTVALDVTGSAKISATLTMSGPIVLSAGSTSNKPLQFVSGALLTSPAAGTIEFLTDAFYGTISTGPARKTFAFLESPSFTTPTLGVASATSINKVAITAPGTSATLTIADGKTLTVSNILTFTGTDSSSVAFGAGGTVFYTGNLGTNVATFLATPTSANLAAALTDETGTGANVFAASPALTGNPTVTNTSAGATTYPLRLINAGGSASTAVALSLDPGGNGANTRDALIRATNNGSNAITLAFLLANAGTPAVVLTLNPDISATFAGAAAFPAGSTSRASIRLPAGVAPTSPVDGDMWTTTSGLFVRINGSTVGPLS